jgi:hypothetical protein
MALSKKEIGMTVNANNGSPKNKPYSAPSLVRFGDMARFTKGGAGSITEAAAGNMNSNFKQ